MRLFIVLRRNDVYSMGKHINFLGYSLWIVNDKEQPPSEALPLNRSFYSPGILAAYCVFANFPVGILLYSINLFRRGYLWRGRLLAGLSGLFLVFQVVQRLFVNSSNFTENRSEFLLNALVAVVLYGTERSHFDRAIRNGGKPARWWLPLILIAGIVAVQFLLQLLLS